MNTITAVILAAGKGTRMKSSMAKVLHEVFFKPMLHHVMNTVQEAGIDKSAVVVGHQGDRVIQSLRGYVFTPVTQKEQLGTGHAVLCAEQACEDSETILVLCGDTPLIRPDTLRAMVRIHREKRSPLTLMTTRLDEPFGYGRILSNADGQVTGIVEEKDASPKEREIKEINAGIYLADRDLLFSALQGVGSNNSQGEVYLTDIVAIAHQQGHPINRFFHPDSIDVLGVNSRVELAQAHAELQRRRNTELMLAGVTMYGPETIYIAQGIPVGQDTVIHPGVQISGNSSIGMGCLIEPGVFLHNCSVANNAVIGAWSSLISWPVQPSEFIAPRTFHTGERGPARL